MSSALTAYAVPPLARQHLNACASTFVVERPPDRLPLKFHRRMPGYVPTPLLNATVLAQLLGVRRLLVKNETNRLGMRSFKVLGASWATFHALETYRRKRFGQGFAPWSSINELAQQVHEHTSAPRLVAATDGNHGHAVAYVARLLGLSAEIYVPRGTAGARVEAIEAEGALVKVVDGGYDDAVRASAACVGEDGLVIDDTSWDGYEDVPRKVIEGYSTIFWEIDEAIQELDDAAPDVVIVQAGVGALAAAVVRHFKRGDGPRPRIIAVEPSGAACCLTSAARGKVSTLGGEQRSIMAGLNCGTPSLVAWPYVSHGVDAFLAIEDGSVTTAIRMLDDVGVTAGETGAAGLAGLLCLLQDDRAAALREKIGVTSGCQVLLLLTEGVTDPVRHAAVLEGVH